MSAGRYRFTTPPSLLRHANLDNLAIVPASLLPFKKQWQEIANTLPNGSILICLPSPATSSKTVLERVAALLRGQGRRVNLIPAERFQ